MSRGPGWKDYLEPPSTPVEYYAPKKHQPKDTQALDAKMRAINSKATVIGEALRGALNQERRNIIRCIREGSWNGSEEIVDMIQRRIEER